MPGELIRRCNVCRAVEHGAATHEDYACVKQRSPHDAIPGNEASLDRIPHAGSGKECDTMMHPYGWDHMDRVGWFATTLMFVLALFVL
ncbi:MAG TPA: hypothetical protein VHA53_04355, partial [Nitrolancea sp.]|nr:hypothetical protein [Nitrolancea sp.]